MDLWLWILFFDVAIAAVLFLIFYGEKKYADYNPNTINFNADMSEFCYFIPRNLRVVRETLTRNSKRDVLYYSFDPENNTILFYSEFSAMPGAAFLLQLTPVRGGTELRLVQQGSYDNQQSLALRQNDFWHKKLEAIPIPYLPTAEKEQTEDE